MLRKNMSLKEMKDKDYFLNVFNECSDYKDKVLFYSFLIGFAGGIFANQPMIVLCSAIGLGCEMLGANATKNYADSCLSDSPIQKFADLHYIFQKLSYFAWLLMIVFCVL